MPELLTADLPAHLLSFQPRFELRIVHDVAANATVNGCIVALRLCDE